MTDRGRIDRVANDGPADPDPDVTGRRIADPDVRDALAAMSPLMDEYVAYYDRHLCPITRAEHDALALDPDYRRIGRSYVSDRQPPHHSFEVATSWLGTNYAPPGAEPEVFETLVTAESLSAADTVWDGKYIRTSSEADAILAHETTVQVLRNTMSDPIVTIGPVVRVVDGEVVEHAATPTGSPTVRCERIRACDVLTGRPVTQ